MGRRKGGKNRNSNQIKTDTGTIGTTESPITPIDNVETPKAEPQSPVVPVPIVVDSAIPEEVQKLVDEHNQATSQGEAEPKQRKKYERRSKPVVDDTETKLTDIKKSIEPLTGMLLRGVNNLYPQPVEVSDEEVQAVNDGVSRVMLKYMESFDRYVPEMMLLGAVALFSLPRIKQPKKKLALVPQ